MFIDRDWNHAVNYASLTPNSSRFMNTSIGIKTLDASTRVQKMDSLQTALLYPSTYDDMMFCHHEIVRSHFSFFSGKNNSSYLGNILSSRTTSVPDGEN